MKLRQFLKLVLVFFTLGIIITFWSTFSNVENSHLVLLLLPVGNVGTVWYGSPAPWLSYTVRLFTSPTVVKFVSEYDFLWFGYFEDVLFYTSILFLIPLFYYLTQLILHWKTRTSLNLDIKQKEVGSQ